MKKVKTMCCLILIVLSSSGQAQDIFDAVRQGDLEKLKALYHLKPDTLNSRNAAGFTPLIVASYRGQTTAVKFLLEHQVEINANSPEGTALLAACYKNDVETAMLLLEHGADPDLQSPQGSTALIFAAMARNKVLVELLLKHGAKKELAEKSGRTALSYARQGNFSEIAGLLEE